MIEQGSVVDFPLNQRVLVYGLPMEFSTQENELSFREVLLGQNNLEILIPDAVIPEAYDFSRALVLKKDGWQTAALLSGVDTKHNNQPVVAMFNLTRPESLRVIVVDKQPETLANDKYPPGGLDFSDLLTDNRVNKVVEITSDSQSLFIRVNQRTPSGI